MADDPIQPDESSPIPDADGASDLSAEAAPEPVDPLDTPSASGDTPPIDAAEAMAGADQALAEAAQAMADAGGAATGEAAPEMAASETPPGTGESPADENVGEPLVANTFDQAELDALAAQIAQVHDAAPKEERPATGAEAPEPAAEEEPVAGGLDQAQQEVDALAAEMAAAIAAEAAAQAGPTPAAGAAPAPGAVPAVLGEVKVRSRAEDSSPFGAPELSEEAGGSECSALDLLDDVQLNVKIELGRASMYIEDVLRLGVGSVVELDKLAGDPVDIFVNDRLIARGEVLVLNENFCVRINDIHSPIPELEDR